MRPDVFIEWFSFYSSFLEKMSQRKKMVSLVSKYFQPEKRKPPEHECYLKSKVFTWTPPIEEKPNIGHVYYEEFKFLWIALKILGMLPYHVNKNGDVVCNFLSKEMIYSIILYITTSIPVYYVLLDRFCHLIHIQKNFDQMMFTIMMSCLMVPHTVIPVSHWLHAKMFQTVCKTWREFQTDYERVTGTALNFHPHWKKFIILPSGLSYCFVIVCYQFFGDVLEDRNYIKVIAHLYVVTFFFLHDVIYVGQAFVIISLMKSFKQKVRKVIQSELEDEIQNYTFLWIYISRLARYVGTLFYKMYFHLLIMLFCVTTLSVYSIIKVIATRNWSMVLINVLVCYKVGQIWLILICECGHRITNEVGENFMVELADMKYRTRNTIMKSKIQEFMEVISQFPPIVSLNGFLTINRKLLVSVVSTGATYVFVVLQFSLSAPTESGEISNSTNSFNCSCN